jgi:mannose-6-phosphate isomerase
VGELWLASGLLEASTRLWSDAGPTLADAFVENRDLFLGPGACTDGFPLLIKAIDTEDVLSVQVHPGRMGFSKEECWYVLEVREGAEIFLGFRPGVTRVDVEEALKRGEMQRLLRSFQPRPGDFFHVPPGTVHALGRGLTLVEVQEPLNVTYRLFDWNRTGLDGRPRALHCKEGLSALAWDRAPEPEPRIDPAEGRTPFLRTTAFEVAGIRSISSVRLSPGGRLSVLVCLEGEGLLRYEDGGEMRVHPLDTFVVPARSAPAVLDGELLLLEARPAQQKKDSP